MKKRGSKKITLVGVILAMLLIQACGTSRSALYGSWKVQTSVDLQAEGLGEMIFEFRSDGVLRVSIDTITVDFTYDFIDDDTIRFSDGGGEIQSILAGQEIDFAVRGNTLSLISNGETVNFNRVDNP